MRRFLFLALALVALNTAGLLYIAHRSAPIAGRDVVANLRVVAFAPDGAADDADRLTVLFDEPVVTPEDIGSRPSTKPFEIEPSAQGHWEWTSVKELSYLLDEPLAPGREYRVVPATNHVSALGRNLVGETEFAFATRRLVVEDCELLSQDNTHATFKVMFNQPVAPGELLGHLQVLGGDGGTPLDVESLIVEPDAELVLRVARLRGRSTQREEVLHLVIKPGLAGDGAQRGLAVAWEKHVALDPVFAFTRLRVPTPGLAATTSLRVQFSRSLDRAQGPADVKVSPPVAQLRTGYSGKDLYVTGAFEPGRRYTLELGAGLRAANGDALGEPLKLTADIPDRRSSLSLPVSRGYLMPGGNLLLDLKAVNVSGVEVSTWRVHDNNLVSHLRGDRVDASSRATGARFVPVELEHNTVGSFALDLRAVLADGGEVPPGIYRVQAHNAESRWVRDSAVIAITDLALTAKLERDGYLVWVTSLDSAKPVVGVTVAGVSYNNQTLATATTDADGLARLAVPPSHPDGDAWVITAQLGPDRSFLLPERRPVMIDTVDQSGRAYADHYEALLYTERGAYRPGDTVHLTGIVRTTHGQLPPDMPLTLTVTRPDGRDIAELPVALSQENQGMFHIDWPSDAEAQLGAYRFRLSTPGGKAIGRVSTLIESFEPVRIAMQAHADAPYIGRDEPVGVQVSARYLFGQPAVGLVVAASSRFVRQSFKSQAYPAYRFDDVNAGDTVTGEVVSDALDAEGAANLVVPSDRLRPHRRGLWETRINLTVTEDGGRSVSQGVSTMVDTAGRYIGVRGPGVEVDGGYAAILTPQTYRWVCVTGEDTLAEPGDAVFVLSRVVRDVLLEEVNGEMVWRTTQTLEEVERWSFEDQAEGAFALTCDRAGLYELRAVDARANSATQVRFYAADGTAQYEALAADRPERIELALDRETYEPGETVVMQVRSAFKSGGTALVTIETDRVIYQQVVEMAQGAASITLPVDASIRGGAFVSVSMVRAVDPADPDWLPHRALGLVRLRTTHEAQRIDATFDAVEHALPGEAVAVMLHTSAVREQATPAVPALLPGVPGVSPPDIDAATTGPRPAAVAHLWAVDEGILLTTAHQTPDAHGFFFALRRGAVRTTDLFADLLPDHERAAGIARIGGDGGGFEDMRRSPVSRPRHDPAVVWRASVPVGPDGTVRATMTMPELHGEMRLMAVVVDGDRYGCAERTLTLSSPVMVESSWPRFAAPGDRFEVPVKMFNNTDTPVAARLGVELDGPLAVDPQALAEPLQIAPNSSATRWLTVTAGGPGPVELRVVAEATGEADGATYRSHQRVSLAVRAAGALQTRSQVVRIDPGEALELDPLAGMVAGTAHLKLRLGGDPAVELMPAADQLTRYPYGCAEQTVGGLVALLHLPELIDAHASADGSFTPTGRAEHVRAMVEAGLHRLWGMQTRSGGIAYWPGHVEPSLWVSAYVGAFLLDADRAGYAVDERFSESLMAYLEAQLNRGGSTRELDDNTRSLICRVLTGFGRPQHGWAGALETGVERLDLAGRAHLAACLLELGRRDRAMALLDSGLLTQKINPTTTGRLTSQVRQEAVLLAVLLELDPDHDWVPLLAERLNTQRAQGHWGTTLNNAAALSALAQYQQQSGPPAPFTGTVQVGDAPPVSFDQTQPLEIDLHGAEGAVRIETAGPGNASVSVVAEGLVEPGDIVEADHNLVVRRRWLDREGDDIDPLALRVGDLVYVELTVRTAEGAPQRHIHNLAIIDALPGGMEVENPRLATSSQDQSYPEISRSYRRTQFLDDRVLLFVSAWPSEATYRYALRVVTPGSFALPPVQGSCMYDPTVSSVNGAGRVEVSR
ncbi:MG2 domain-containing protein [Phycisphaeraceae bacterium D3-23]